MSQTKGAGFDLYQAIGGREACLRLSAAFYTGVEQDAVLRPLFPGKNHRCAIEAFAAFLAQFLGGPAEDAEFRWWLSLRESHQRFSIGHEERDAWMRKMVKALDEVRFEEPVRSALRGLFEQSSAYLVNSSDVPRGAAAGDPIHRAIGQRWEGQLALDAAVAAVRAGDADGAIRLADRIRPDRAVFTGLLAVMIGNGGSALLDYVGEELEGDPSLAEVRFSGRTLLHAASGAGSLTIVELLLRLGADPNATDGGGHAPLYSVGNECTTGGEVVRVLVRAGAKVDGREGVKHCTALHMAARRGNVEAAEALLDCGADIEARDSVGDTPLRRAVNCGKTAVAASLISRGANLNSRGSKGLTPLLAARTAAMKRVLALEYGREQGSR